MKRKPDIAIMMVVLLSLLGFAPHAQAYLDPSTGSMILSAMLSFLLPADRPSVRCTTAR